MTDTPSESAAPGFSPARSEAEGDVQKDSRPDDAQDGDDVSRRSRTSAAKEPAA